MEEEAEDQQQQEEEKKEKLTGPSPIHAVYYDNGDPNKFWVSVGGYDAGYLYSGSLEGSGDDCESYEMPHTLPVPDLNGEDVPIHSMVFRLEEFVTYM